MAPLLAVDNYVNRRMYPDHTITVTSEQEGHEAHELYSGRRDAGSYHAPNTDDDDHSVIIAFDRVRALNFFALDRQHNLAGYPIVVSVSSDGFVTEDEVIDITLPTVSAPGNPFDALGVRTEEGAHLQGFDLVAGSAVKLSVPAMGASLRANIGNLFLGFALSLEALTKPVQDYRDVFSVTELEAEGGGIGRGFPGRRRQGTITYRFNDFAEFDDLARLHLDGHFGDGRPTWILHDQDQGHRAVLAVRQAGDLDFAVPTDRAYRTVHLPWVEWEPKVAA